MLRNLEGFRRSPGPGRQAPRGTEDGTRQEKRGLDERPGGRAPRARIYGIRRRDRWRRPGGPLGGDPAAPEGGGRGFRPFGLRDREGLGSRRAYSFRRGGRSRRPRRADPRLARAGRPGRYGSDGGSFRLSRPGRRRSRAELPDAAADEQSRQLHRQPGQSVPLAGHQGRRAGRGNLSRLRGRRDSL